MIATMTIINIYILIDAFLKDFVPDSVSFHEGIEVLLPSEILSSLLSRTQFLLYVAFVLKDEVL